MNRMQYRSLAGVAASALLLAGGGCATDPKAGDAGVNYDPVKIKQAGGAGPGSAQQADFSEMPTPPAGAQYTIYCQAYAGPDHQNVARGVRNVLRANTGMDKWYVVHGDQQSTLYYGFYRTLDKHDPADAREGERALADLDAVRTLHDSRGVRLFSASLPVSVNSPDPAANPAWDLTRSGGYWSLEVATFKDTPDRKLRAVQAVAEARREGHDAYYYHGPHASSVCIGAWPRAAATEVGTDVQNVNPDEPIVVTPSPLTAAYKEGLGKGVQTAAPRVDPVDPSMLAAIAAWPAHAVNGFTMMKPDAGGGATDVPLERSFLFVVPNATDVAVAANDEALPTVDIGGVPGRTGSEVAPPARAGSGQLRSLDDAH